MSSSSESSTLADTDRRWVEWGDRAYALTVHRESTTTTRVYDYVADHVAADTDSFRRYLHDRFVVQFEGLTDEERTIVEHAIDGGYEEKRKRPHDAWHRLVERLGDPVYPKDWYTWYVEYESETYFFELSSSGGC